MPKRIKYRRGMNLPSNTVYVGRPTDWGNPYVIGMHGTREQVLGQFQAHVDRNPELAERAKKELRGCDLACWCDLDKDCHADIWMEIAND